MKGIELAADRAAVSRLATATRCRRCPPRLVLPHRRLSYDTHHDPPERYEPDVVPEVATRGVLSTVTPYAPALTGREQR